MGDKNHRARLMMSIVAKIVCNEAGITMADLKASSCSHKVSKARFVFVELCEGLVSPVPLVAEFLSKNISTIAYYKRSYDNYYSLYADFKDLSDRSSKVLTDLLTEANGTFENVIQEER